MKAWTRASPCADLGTDEALAEMERSDAILRGYLSRCRIYMMLYWPGEMLDINPAKDWWHARCGHAGSTRAHTTDPARIRPMHVTLPNGERPEAARTPPAARGEAYASWVVSCEQSMLLEPRP